MRIFPLGVFMTIDITELVERLRNSFVVAQVDAVFASIASITGFGWVTLPVISTLVRAAIGFVIGRVADTLVMHGFFLNTAIRKADQAHEYLEASREKDRQAPTATDEEYERLERVEIDRFRDLVSAVG